jgi:uncharacterized membrane protein
MGKERLEAFSDGVFAVIITIMVLELKVPQGSDLTALRPVIPVFLSYALSFVFVAIYWNNHHHMLQAAKKVNGAVLWANLHLLFWLSFVPFITVWMGENHGVVLPVALYGSVLFLSGLAYYILSRALISINGKDSALAKAVGKDFKGILSLVIYAFAVAFSFVHTWISIALYISVAVMWFIPDPRIEHVILE